MDINISRKQEGDLSECQRIIRTGKNINPFWAHFLSIRHTVSNIGMRGITNHYRATLIHANEHKIFWHAESCKASTYAKKPRNNR
jgi:hypothetical protein